MAQTYVNKLPNDVIFWKLRHIVIVRFHSFIATSIVHFQLEVFEFITMLNKQLLKFEFV